jgi:tetratricopeptide (TPR) repeat protein
MLRFDNPIGPSVRNILLVALLLVQPLLTPLGSANAQSSSMDAEARSIFSAGQVAFESGRFERALEHFLHAYELSGRAQLLFNIAVTHDRLRHDREALAMFEQYLAAVPDAPNREEVEGRIAILRDAVSHSQPTLAISPADAAAAANEAQASAPITTRDTEARVPITRKWWFWTLLGVAVAGVATGVAVAVHDPGTEAPLPGSGGVIVRARGAR